METPLRIAVRAIIVLLTTVAATATTDTYERDQWTLGSRGEVWDTGGDYGLSSTVGQPGVGVLAGGVFVPSGALPPALRDTRPAFRPIGGP